MESMTISWTAGQIPSILSDKPFSVVCPVRQLSHIETIHTMLNNHFSLLSTVPDNFSEGITSGALSNTVQNAIDGNVMALDVLQAMLLSLGVTLEPVSAEFVVVNDAFIVVIRSENPFEPPAMLFVNIVLSQTTLWAAYLSDGETAWRIFSADTSSFFKFLQDLNRCSV